ncbi:MAG: hypothetical protein SGILL_001695, partial [Bacillariaceae sp.]
NPNGKHHYAKSTAKYEKELKMLEETIDLLSTEEAEILSVTAKHLKEKLQALWYQKSRYNGKEIKKTVPRLVGFADATDHGWMFTGSSDNTVEFYEKNLVEAIWDGSGNMISILKLEWFFQTGVAKMILEHPIQGVVPLVDQRLAPQAYLRFLTKPLTAGNAPSSPGRKNGSNGYKDGKGKAKKHVPPGMNGWK